MASVRADIEGFILNKVSEYPKDIALVTANEFGISRQRAFSYIQRLVNEGKIIKTGRTRGTKYFLSTGDNIEVNLPLTSELEEDKLWTQYVKPKLSAYPKNIYDICHWGFTEMVNNAIDHSEGTKLYFQIEIRDGKIILRVMDNGIGIFRKIQKALDLSSPHESILHLSKGKFTTDPSRHSGLGIFFTSRVFEKFGILSSDMLYIFEKGEWLLSEEHKKDGDGTYVRMEIPVDSDRTAKKIMDKYADADEEIGFHKTEVSVKLSGSEDDPHVSRSQAKRLLMGLDKFKYINLDFNNINSIGQAFADEIFRVFQNEHPDIKITFSRANDDVEQMIRRAKSS